MSKYTEYEPNNDDNPTYNHEKGWFINFSDGDNNAIRIFAFGNKLEVVYNKRYSKSGEYYYFIDGEDLGNTAESKEEFRTQLKIRNTKVWQAMYGEE